MDNRVEGPPHTEKNVTFSEAEALGFHAPLLDSRQENRMRPVLWCLRTIVFSIVAAIVGCFLAGASYMTALILPHAEPNSSIAEEAGSVVFLAIMGGWAGIFFGLLLGLVPTLVLGASLSMLKTRYPFQYGVTWVATGAAGGLAIGFWGEWTVAWIIGGAASAWTYWGLETRVLAKRDFSWLF